MKSIDDKIKLLGLPYLCNIHDDVMVRNYDFDFDKKHDWIQSIQYLLSLNGLGNIWLQPPSCNNSIIKSYGRIFSKVLKSSTSRSGIKNDKSKLNFILNSENQASLICNYVLKLLKERNL